MQPMVSDDVAAAVADVALGEPMNAIVEVAGPDRIRQDEFVRQFLTATGDPRNVVTDASAGYYGIKVNDQSLVPGDNPRLGTTRFEEWLSRTTPQMKAIERQSAPASNLPGKVTKVVTFFPFWRNRLRRSVQGDRNDGRHDGTQGGKVDGAYVERHDGPSWKEGLMLMIEYPPGHVDPNTSPQRTWIYLCAGRLDRNAGQGRERSDSDTWSDLL